jgi:hypothetical protein
VLASGPSRVRAGLRLPVFLLHVGTVASADRAGTREAARGCRGEAEHGAHADHPILFRLFAVATGKSE